MSWRAVSLVNIARVVTGCHLPQETRVYNALDEVASNICLRPYPTLSERALLVLLRHFLPCANQLSLFFVLAFDVLDQRLEVDLQAGTYTHPSLSSPSAISATENTQRTPQKVLAASRKVDKLRPTLVHFSSYPEDVSVTASAQHIPQKVLTVSRTLDKCELLPPSR